jgi:hypothetical protein
MNLRIYITAFIIAFLVFRWLFATKTDIIILKNGDHITGEVKKLEYGRLSYSTDDMGTVSVEWDKINYLWAKENFRVELDEGRFFYGSLGSDTTTGMILVILDSLAAPLEKSKIVKMTPIKDTFKDRLDLSVNLGFNIFKASNMRQLYYNADAKYRTFKDYRHIYLSSTLTNQTDKETQRHDGSVSYNRILKRKWFLNGLISFAKNTEQGLNLRIAAGGGGGRNVIQTNSSILVTGLGMQVNREYGQDSQGDKYNLEGIATITFDAFKYDTPKLDLKSDLNAYPNLSSWGRVRIDLNIELSWEIIKDLFWNLTFKNNFDSDPPTEGAEKNVYELIVSFGWKW